uniref:Uncharacterized protein n=1 Tax=Timema bartmani TaxID=61472 RepID=A0A7R9I823_9NEOP|nr:unnamed protein product [Timema bartmani]
MDHIQELGRFVESCNNPREQPTEVRARDMTLQPPGAIARVDDTKSRSNSCTDSSGVSSCDSGLGRHVISERIQTLSPIPSSASLSTLKSAGVQGDRTRKMSMHSSTTSEGLAVSPDVAHMRLSQQDLLGYATLRSLKRHCRPMYSDTSILATAELIGFDDHGASKVRSLDRQFSQTILCEFESSSPPPLLDGSSIGAKPYIGSRSNITSKLSGSTSSLLGRVVPS